MRGKRGFSSDVFLILGEEKRLNQARNLIREEKKKKRKKLKERKNGEQKKREKRKRLTCSAVSYDSRGEGESDPCVFGKYF